MSVIGWSAWWPLRHVRLVACVSALVAVFAVVGAGRASAAAFPASLQSTSVSAWPANIESLPPPPAPGSQPFDGIDQATTACDPTGTCASVGSYTDTSGNTDALVTPITDGVAHAAVPVQLPAGAETTGQDATLAAVSCSPSGNCDAVGSYLDKSGIPQAMVEPIIAGVPQRAVAVTGMGVPASLTDISCPSSGPCVAVGYVGSVVLVGHPARPAIVTVSGTSVSAPTLLSAGGIGGTVTGVSCYASSTCTAVGFFGTNTGVEVGFTVPVVNGVAGVVSDVTPPSSSGTPRLILQAISCPSAGSCLATGVFALSTSSSVVVVVSVNNGVPGAAASQITALGTGKTPVYPTAIGCSSGGECYVVANSPTMSLAPIVIPVSNGLPGTTVKVTAGANPYASLTGIGCTQGYCVASGDSVSGGLVASPLLVLLSGGVVSPGAIAQQPAGATLAFLTSVGCSASGSCVAYGNYTTQSGPRAPFVLSVQAPLAITSTSLPGAARE